MGASSVTGTGTGSADKKIKTSDISLEIGKLIGPKVSAAGKTCLIGSNTVVQIPALLGNAFDHIIILTATTNTPCYVSSSLELSSESNCWKFTITGDSGSSVYWAIIKIGF
jgi:hypothetical protein